MQLLLIILLALFAASSECLLNPRTNFAFATLRSGRSKRSIAELSSSSNHQSSDYQIGKPSSYYIVGKYNVPADGFPDSSLERLFEEADIKRLNMTTTNVTLPSALAMLDSNRYPDMRSSLKAARNGSILIQRQHHKQQQRGRSGDRIYPNDILYRQEQLDIGASEYWHKSYNASFRNKNDNSQLVSEEEGALLPVIFEDEHIAIVNKPGGMNMFNHDSHHTTSSGEENRSRSVKDLLPFVLKPPPDGTHNVLAIPEPAHRLDKGTSGLLLVAKTRPALSNLSAQFRNRTIEKTYTAICYNVPAIIPNDPTNGNDDWHDDWQCIDKPLDGKSAITFWRVLEEFEHKVSKLSLLELKPKTGRYRQLRRHMAKTKLCPLVGDTVFAKGIENKDGGGGGVPMAKKLGLFLCSSAVRFDHPYHKGSEHEIGDGVAAQLPTEIGHQITCLSEGGTVVMNVRIEVPRKFAALLE